ncbi:hypothetical protein ACVPOQ_13930 [Staphylococcus aureus]
MLSFGMFIVTFIVRANKSRQHKIHHFQASDRMMVKEIYLVTPLPLFNGLIAKADMFLRRLLFYSNISFI